MWELAHQLFDYDPETGIVTRKVDRGDRFKAGERVGTPAHGYLQTRFNGRTVYLHRLIWLMRTGSWPDRGIDHTNGDPADNRWANLRLATRNENGWNVGLTARNKSGFKGVHQHTQNGRWVAQIRQEGRSKYLGIFNTPEEAGECYRRAAQELHGEFFRKEG
jgi:HNH endonuclease/AP2 domain